MKNHTKAFNLIDIDAPAKLIYFSVVAGVFMSIRWEQWYE